MQRCISEHAISVLDREDGTAEKRDYNVEHLGIRAPRKGWHSSGNDLAGESCKGAV